MPSGIQTDATLPDITRCEAMMAITQNFNQKVAPDISSVGIYGVSLLSICHLKETVLTSLTNLAVMWNLCLWIYVNKLLAITVFVPFSIWHSHILWYPSLKHSSIYINLSKIQFRLEFFIFKYYVQAARRTLPLKLYWNVISGSWLW